jgi:uncharacterized protein YwgA
MASMDCESLVLAAMAGAGENAIFSPAQVQKLFFILDREASQYLDGPHFDFVPYNYGPFDSAVYDCLDRLSNRKLVLIGTNGRYRQYALSHEGYRDGVSILSAIDGNIRNYICQVAKWILSMDFQTLISTIYSKYPDMRVNSVFVS